MMAGPSLAGSLTVNFAAGVTNVTTALTGYSTYGDMMSGMNVQAFFQGGTSQTAVWATTGSGAGAATGTGWSLSESGDTFGSTWALNNSGDLAISRVLIDAGPGDTVFDTRYLGDIDGTPGSARGWDFTLVSGGDPFNIIATYRDQVALTGQNPVGDLYRYLDIVFQDTLFSSNNTLGFIADTDNILFAGDIKPVPLPGAIVLLGSGLLGLVGIGFRKRRN